MEDRARRERRIEIADDPRGAGEQSSKLFITEVEAHVHPPEVGVALWGKPRTHVARRARQRSFHPGLCRLMLGSSCARNQSCSCMSLSRMNGLMASGFGRLLHPLYQPASASRSPP